MKTLYHSSRRVAGSLLVLLAMVSNAADWPQFLGPNRNLKTTSDALNLDWPAGSPPKLWEKKIGTGWSGPVMVEGHLIQHHRQGDEEVVACFDPLTGSPKWEYRSRTDYRDRFGFDNGPRATPAIRSGHVYTFGPDGRVQCLKLDDGSLMWSVDTRKEFEADLGFFGLDSSPLVENGLVMLQVGGSKGRGIVALDAETGELRWGSTEDEAGYSSPVLAKIGDRNYGLFFTREGLAALDPLNGHVYWKFPWRSKQQSSVNAASPVVMGRWIFISASYGTGAVALEVNDDNIRLMWQGDGLLSNHYATSIYHQNMLFGFHGRVDTGGPVELRCLDANKGTILWQLDALPPGNVTLVNDTLLVLTEDGELVAADASPRGFKPRARAQILGGDTRAYPAFADGLFWARDKGKLVALDLRMKSD